MKKTDIIAILILDDIKKFWLIPFLGIGLLAFFYGWFTTFWFLIVKLILTKNDKYQSDLMQSQGSIQKVRIFHIDNNH